jgi:hypothetical protein
MSPDDDSLGSRLRDAASSGVLPLAPSSRIRSRARRRQATRRVAGGVAGLALVGGLAAGLDLVPGPGSENPGLASPSEGTASPSPDEAFDGLALQDGWEPTTAGPEGIADCPVSLDPGPDVLTAAQQRVAEGGDSQWRGVFELPDDMAAAQVFETFAQAEVNCSGRPSAATEEETLLSRTQDGIADVDQAVAYSYRNPGPVGGADFLVVQQGSTIWFGQSSGEFGHASVFSGIKELKRAFALDRDDS